LRNSCATSGAPNRVFPAAPSTRSSRTADGYLWIGAESGLVRFDSVGFHLFNHLNTALFPDGRVLGLRSDNSGGLWIRLHSPGLLRYHEGKSDVVFPESTEMNGSGVV
jgi:ligand-binding sensor domain-containing protein